MQQFHPATIFRICFFLLVGNIFAACHPQMPSFELAKPSYELGAYRFQALTGEKNQALQDLSPAYRLVSMQDSGYLVSTDTGLSYVVDAAGNLTSLDKRNGELSGSSGMAGDEKTRLFAATDNAVWSLSTQKLKHSEGLDDKTIAGDKVQALWFSARQIMLWGKYQRHDGSINSGLQLYSLNADKRLKLTTIINVKTIKERVPSFSGAEKFIAGGLTEQDMWLWTRESGLLLFTKNPDDNKCCRFEDNAVISFPSFSKVIKDIGLHIQITVEGDSDQTKYNIHPPEYVVSIAEGKDKRGALYIARNPAAN